ncbi:MAG: hypothetical protein AB1724_19035 [Thermodesulfobacteriota bacterium]
MNTEKKQTAGTPSENPEELKKEMDRLLGELAVNLMGDPKAQQTLQAVAGAVMSAWSGGSVLKKIISWMALKTMPALPPGDKSGLADMAATLGRFLVLRWRLRTREIRENPTEAADNQSAFVKSLLDNIDLSQWKTLLETSKEGRIEAARRLNEILPQYQGKILVVLAALPTVISLAANTLNLNLASQIKVLPPEMLFEIASGLNGKIDWKEVGRMLNDYYELGRRVHIGSSLGGDGVTPALQTLTGDMLKEIVSEIDPQRYAEAVAGKAGDREAIKNAVSDMMHAFPEFGRKMLTAAALSENARIRAMKNRLRVLADLPGRDLDEVVAEVAGAFDEQELADLISLVLEITNHVTAGDPERIPGTVSALAATIDTEEVRTLAESDLIRDICKAARPVALILLPPLINGLCDLLTPDSEDNAEDLRSALARLAGILGDANAE